MAFLSMDDPEFWGRCPEGLESLVQGDIGASVASSYFLLGKQTDDPPTVIALRMGPNWVSARHAHDCHRFEIVVQGALDVGERVLKPGDVMVTEPGVAYGPHVAGPEGCTTFEIFSDYRSSYVTLIEDPEGLAECDLSTAEGQTKMLEFMERTSADSPAP